MKKPRMARWSYRWESNPQPIDYKSIALPIELRQHVAAPCGNAPHPLDSKSSVLLLYDGAKSLTFQIFIKGNSLRIIQAMEFVMTI